MWHEVGQNWPFLATSKVRSPVYNEISHFQNLSALGDFYAFNFWFGTGSISWNLVIGVEYAFIETVQQRRKNCECCPGLHLCMCALLWLSSLWSCHVTPLIVGKATPCDICLQQLCSASEDAKIKKWLGHKFTYGAFLNSSKSFLCPKSSVS